MCRIAGIVNYESPPSVELILQMRDAMLHGGPDDAGIYLDNEHPLAFGHRRLSLIDLSSQGHQPMNDFSNQVVLIFNGEIYNFQQIKEDLIRKKYSFRSNSDTEVILYAYIEWGIGCFKHFNGMFSLALLDKRNNKLILARDHAGIKPLYYSLQKNKIYFASEVKAFTKIKQDWPENKDWKKYFLMFGHLPEPITTLENVTPLPKGTVLQVDLPSLKITTHRFFALNYNYPINNRDEAIEKVRNTLVQSVKRHLISDAPIGLFLSGGLDSSLLTLIAKSFLPTNLHTISIVFENEKFSEKHFQDIIIKKTKTHHRSFLVTETDFKNSLSDILEAMDQPSNDGVNTYFICKYAQQCGLKAVLSGLGADEIFGGYQSFDRSHTVKLMRSLPHYMFRIAGIFPDDRKKKITFLGIKGGLGEYLLNRGFFIPREVAELLDCSVEEVNRILDDIQMHIPAFIEKLMPREKISYLETNLYMQNQLLKDTDYMSMWHGVEVRVPFLDKELLELAYSINPDARYNPKQSKYLLIEAFKDILPTEIWKRPKQGFSFPFEQWMKHITLPQGAIKKSEILRQGLVQGNIHWSRYWSYIISQQRSK